VSTDTYLGALWIPDMLTPSLNVVLRWNRWRRAAEGRDWERAVLCAEAFSPVPKCGRERRRVEISRYGGRLLDADNAAGGAKALVDALRRRGLLFDDSPKWCDLAPIRSYPAGQRGRGMLVQFWRLPAADGG